MFVAIDGFFPTIPGEALVVTSGVFAASGQPELPLVVLVAAAGGVTGDHVSYGIGRLAGSRLLERMRPGTRKRKPFDWAVRTLRQRGGSVLIVCRFVPGCRTAATLTTGSVRFPLPSFAGFSSLGGLCWASYFTMVGYLGGITFREHPLLGVLLGIALAVLLAEPSRAPGACGSAGREGDTTPPPTKHPGNRLRIPSVRAPRKFSDPGRAARPERVADRRDRRCRR